MPEAALFEPLCGIWGLTLAELLRGERSVTEVPALEQAAVEAVALAGTKEKIKRNYKRLAALLAILLLLAGYALGWPVYQSWKVQKHYDRDDVAPIVSLEYSNGRKNVRLTLMPHGMCGPFESGHVMVDYPEAAVWLPGEPADLILQEITELQVVRVQLAFAGEKSQMEVKVLRWPYDGTSGQSLETGEEVPLCVSKTDRTFLVEKGHLYSVVVTWGDGYYHEYPFPVR